MTNEEARNPRETSAELLRLETERQEADRALLAAMERGDRPEVKRLRSKVTGLMHDIAALRFDLTAEHAGSEPAGPPPMGGPGWMGMVQDPRRKDG